MSALEFTNGYTHDKFAYGMFDFYWRVLEGKSEEILANNLDMRKELNVDCVLTDPPYATGLAEWDTNVGPQKLYDLCYEILKPGGYFVAFASSMHCHETTDAIRRAGFEICDMLIWRFEHRSPKGKQLGKALRKQRTKSLEMARRDKRGDLIIRDRYAPYPIRVCKDNYYIEKIRRNGKNGR